MTAALALCAVFCAVLLRAIVAGTRDWMRDQRLAEHIGRLGYDQTHGCVQRLTEADFAERRR